MSETRRIFFALWPPDKVCEQLSEQTRLYIPDNTRPVTRSNLHMTLAFIGSVNTKQLSDYEHAASSLRANAFSLTLDQSGYFAHARVLWLGCSKSSDALLAFVSRLNERLRLCGYQSDDRPFVPHVTLARKYRQPHAVEMPVSIEWCVNDFSLVESRSTPAGIEYHVLKSWPLVPAGL